MPDRDPRTPPERPSATGPWQVIPPGPPRGASDGPGDPPTVRSGPASAASASPATEPSDLGRGSRPASRHDPAHPLPSPGDGLDAFVIEETIGVGGMGAVFRAHDGQLDRTVALKILPPEQAKDPEAVQRFYQESRAAARLDHENIARVFTIGHSPPYHYIAFEFIEGSNLRQLVERGGVLSVGDAINYTLQITTALVHASERDVVHRDVKPSNIIVTPQGRAKLVDMGLARRFERGGDHGLTQTGMTLGTFDYISPEQARDPRDVDVRSDLYSLGCTLYYMLAGRPPFPDGTVLQKLLQHQEEPPPDIRLVNHAVPADLAAILLKLMAKDRDRRYQSPEGLVRDLLLVAGALNLRSLSPEGLVWLDAAPAPAWERHLVWGVPALAFGALILFLVWNGQAVEPNPTPSFPVDVVSSPPRVARPNANSQAAAQPQPPPSRPVDSRPAPASTPPGPGRDVIVRKSDDLIRLASEATPGTTLLLADDGPHELRPGPSPLTLRDVTIRAGVGVQPVLRLAHGTALARTAPALLDLKGGRVTLDGLEFALDSDDRDLPLAAVRGEDAEVTLTRCIFRRVGLRPERGRTAGLQLRETSDDASWKGAAEVVIDSCHFDGGQHAVFGDGPIDLTVRDATLAGFRLATVACVNGDAAGRAASLRFNRASVQIGDGPFLRATGLPPRVRVNDSVLAPAGEAPAALVVADEPARLVWQGRDNLYHRIGAFLQADRGSAAGFAPIRSFTAWSDDPASVREAGSTLSVAGVWAEADPPSLLAGDSSNPSLAFRLAAGRAAVATVGARRGPFGPLLPPARATTAPIGPLGTDPPPAGQPPAIGLARAEAGPAAGDTAARVVSARATADEPSPMPRMGDPAEEMPPEMPVMPPPGAGLAEDRHPIPGEVEPKAAAPGPNTLARGPGLDQTPARPGEATLIRSLGQFSAALERAGGKGETLRLGAGSDWEMSACRIRGAGTWAILGEPGKARPRIRFRPRPGDSRVSSAWTAWLSVPSGSIRIEGIDFVLPREDAPDSGGWAAFAVAAGADLSLADCTVTIEGSAVPSAVILAPTGRDARAQGEPALDAPTTIVRIRDSFFRSGGDLIDVAPDRRLDLQLDQTLVATSGSLLHGHGGTRAVPAQPLKATLRRITARAEQGLVRLDGAEGEPELPATEVVARDSIFATDGKGAPLIRVDGPGDPEGLRDRVRWDGQGVAYHRITNYRRDQVLRPGEFPVFFDKQSWELAVGRRESAPLHGDAGFVSDWPDRRPAWAARPDDLRIRPDGAAARGGAGPEMGLIPEPPPSRS